MKINIFFNIGDGPRGGANQFLRGLRNELIRRGLYEEDPMKADAVILNSYHRLGEIFSFLLTRPKTVLIHRLGPIFRYHRNNAWGLYDRFILRFADTFADGIIFQSKWSQRESGILGLEKSAKTAIIHNAADGSIFNQNNTKKVPDADRRFRLIASSNSDNREKGLDYFEFLDKNLDFTRYEMKFVGRSKTEFANIEHTPPQDPKRLAELLGSADAYISPVRNEACSNAILEAFACGLPVIALDDSSNPELVGSAGELFHDKDDLLGKIERVRNGYTSYTGAIRERSISDVTERYTRFIEEIIENGAANKKSKAKLSLYSLLHHIVRLLVFLADKIVHAIKNRQFHP